MARTWLIRPDATGDAPTIQAGIDSSAAGDTVFAMSGEYFENIDFKGKEIIVQGSSREATTINGSGNGSCVVFKNGERRESILTGFTIKEGSGQFLGGTYWGGGIFGLGSEPQIIDNIIELNRASEGYLGRGGGIYFGQDGAELYPLIRNNILRFNKAGSNGGGIACEGNVAPIIDGNTIFANEAIWGDGGGIWLFTLGSGSLVKNNVLDQNDAGDHAGGILISGQGIASTYEISRNLISRNRALFRSGLDAGGGGVYLAGTAEVWLHHNTVVGNGSGGPADAGGGVVAQVSPATVIEQNVIALTTNGSGILCFPPAPRRIENNLAWDNTGGDGAGSCATWWQSNGNMVADPDFCNANASDFSVAENSPALTHPAGPVGAFPDPGCGPVSVESTTWGRLKARY